MVRKAPSDTTNPPKALNSRPVGEATCFLNIVGLHRDPWSFPEETQSWSWPPTRFLLYRAFSTGCGMVCPAGSGLAGATPEGAGGHSIG
jgi:hypothetical protein